MIKINGDTIIAEFDYPCKISRSECGMWSILAEFVSPRVYCYRNAVSTPLDSAPLVQLREKGGHFLLVYFRYDDMPEEYLPEWWKDSTVVWEKRAERDKENLPKPTTQVEEIVWHKFSDDRPPLFGIYQVQIGYESPACIFTQDTWDGFRFSEAYKNKNIVFAWSELPKGWKE
jgi:hypothetical protein